MAGYVDVYAVPVPKKHLAKYKRIAQRWGKMPEAEVEDIKRQVVASLGRLVESCDTLTATIHGFTQRLQQRS